MAFTSLFAGHTFLKNTSLPFKSFPKLSLDKSFLMDPIIENKTTKAGYAK